MQFNHSNDGISVWGHVKEFTDYILTFKNDKKQFENTADSIDNMWRSAKPVDIEKYRKELLAVYMKYWTYTIEETV